MTSPRGTYGGGYYSSPAFADTPIYDRLVSERGTPQIAPIRVPAAYDTGSHLPALPSALPALPPAPSAGGYHTPAHGTTGGYPAPPQPAAAYQPQPPAPSMPAPYIPQQAGPSRGYSAGGYQGQPQSPYQSNGAGYDTSRPVPPRPLPPRQVPAPYNYAEDPYRRSAQGY
ncbi:DUF6643 family protein [Streptomyces sp. NPDC059506]|uniref:DUF6643 family protein n=1 Tax=Streptomyces TaxID=1883 RepID=UPI0015FCA7A2|nr:MULTISPECIES: DUF6643 family protein [unclassified Streptomyces]MCZ2524956.1 hypothetical protein [Streptomyces sp. HB2AG]QMV20822.1 hypothetical protein GQS52_02365 [Streptomyces sp. SCUT-3]